jgi:potassium efflux system protein
MRRPAFFRPAHVLKVVAIFALAMSARTVVWAGPATPAGAAKTENAAPAPRPTLEETLAKRKELAEQIRALSKQDPQSAGGNDSLDVSDSEDELEFLEALDGIYGEQQARIEQRQELETEKQRAQADLDALRKFGPSDSKPYSFLLLEELRDELAAEEDHETVNDADLKPAAQMVEAAQAHFDQAERERRRIQESVAEKKHPEKQAALATELKLAQRESQVAKELITVRELEVDVRTLRRDVSALRKTLLTEKIALIERDVRFTRQDVQERLKELTSIEGELNAKLKNVRANRRHTELEQAASLKELKDAKAPSAVMELAAESWHVARDAQQIEMSLLDECIGDARRLRHYWECRFAAETGTATPADLTEWRESLDNLLTELGDRQRSLSQQVEATRAGQAKVVQRMRDNDDAQIKKWGEFQATQWQSLREVCETHLVQLAVTERWAARFYDELDARLKPRGSVSWRAKAEEHLATAWQYEVFMVNDRPITIGKIATLIFCLCLSVFAARVLSRVLGQQVLPRFGLNEGASHAIRAMAFYSLAMLFGVLSFQVVHIPLSAFAFLGGAVAIAIGFGSQDIANNFMSGIILLAEQPIRVGDIVMVDGVQGTVEHIGPRSTRIKTDANHEIVVPNSKLLSDKVTNLTLSDTLIQTTVAVTLPTKIHVKEAKGLLLAAALSQPAVLHDPCPVVLFKQFGVTTMDFELHFWLQLHDEMQAAIAQSDVREAINDLFLEQNAQAAISTPPPAVTPVTGRANAA